MCSGTVQSFHAWPVLKPLPFHASSQAALAEPFLPIAGLDVHIFFLGLGPRVPNAEFRILHSIASATHSGVDLSLLVHVVNPFRLTPFIRLLRGWTRQSEVDHIFRAPNEAPATLSNGLFRRVRRRWVRTSHLQSSQVQNPAPFLVRATKDLSGYRPRTKLPPQ